MQIPEGYEKLAVIGISYKGEYVEGTEYKYLNAVYYNGSTYVALKDGVTSVPYNDGINWKYLAQGFISHNLSELEAVDTEGILGTAGDSVGAQELIDGIADDLKNGDTAENTVTFTSADDLEPEAWEDVDLIESGEKQKSLFNKISTMFKNTRYLFGLLGNTDISTIGNGTVTGAISSLNADLSNVGIVYSYSYTGLITNAQSYKTLIKYNVAENGLYLCIGTVMLLGATSNNRMSLSLISTEGGLNTSAENSYPTTYKTLSVFNISQLKSNEEIELKIYTDVVANNANNNFSFLLVRLK